MKTPVALVKCAEYDQHQVDEAVRRALDLLGGLDRFVSPGQKALLKINLLASTTPEEAVTTHPAVIRAVARLVRDADATPVAGDCSGWEGPANKNRYSKACLQAGVTAVCEEENIELVHLSAEAVEVDNPGGRAFKRFALAKYCLDADVVINMPKLKTHGLCLFTGGVKNVLGCVPGLGKAQLHLRAQGIEYFSQALVDLYGLVRPALTVMDGIVGMDGPGPRNGNLKQIGALLAAADAVALDCVACAVVGVEPFVIPTTRLAHEQGVGTGKLDEIDILGDTPADIGVTGFELPKTGGSTSGRTKTALSFLQGRVLAKPVVVRDKCGGCWVCVEHCPPEAMSKEGRVPGFDYDKCIRCYCCQELCPNDAIRLKRPLLARIL